MRLRTSTNLDNFGSKWAPQEPFGRIKLCFGLEMRPQGPFGLRMRPAGPFGWIKLCLGLEMRPAGAF